jgi:release factor glutamine methyltransferase
LAHVLGSQRIDLYVRSEELADADIRSRYRALIEQRIAGCPVAYLVGHKEFFLLPIEVSPAVLIPRPATESLVLAAIERLRTIPAPTILDVGTGSGCIAVALAVRLPNSRLVATDVSLEALDVARRNAEVHGVAGRIDFRLGPLYQPVGGDQFDAVVGNPPYIPTGDIANLEREVREHEPAAALDGGADGLGVIQPLIVGAAAHLKSGGWLLLEIGAGQSAAVERLVTESDDLRFNAIVPDRDGIPRVLQARRA